MYEKFFKYFEINSGILVFMKQIRKHNSQLKDKDNECFGQRLLDLFYNSYSSGQKIK